MTCAHHTVRRLTVADTAAYKACRLESLKTYPDAFGTSYAEDEARPSTYFSDVLKPDSDASAFSGVFGGFVEDGLMGIVGFYKSQPVRMQHNGILCAMYVSAGLQGSSIAGDLLTAVLSHAKGRVELMKLSVVASNGRARRFYEKHGFTAYGIEPRALKTHAGYLDEILMWREVL